MTTEYLLDTNACIAIRDLLSAKSLKSPERRRRIEQLKARWSAVPQEHLAMSAITLGELRFGAAKSNNPAGVRARLDDLRRRIRVLPLDETVADHQWRRAVQPDGSDRIQWEDFSASEEQMLVVPQSRQRCGRRADAEASRRWSAVCIR